MSSANSDNFTFSFPIWIPLISFSSLIAMARTSQAMLNSSGESRYPCLVLHLSGNSFSFSPLRIMLAVVLSYIAGSFCAHFLKVFFLSEMGVRFC